MVWVEKFATHLITNNQPNAITTNANQSQMITNDQTNGSQMINPFDYKQSTKRITNDQPN